MMSLDQVNLVIFAVLLMLFIAELLAGRHRNLYTANDYLVNGLCLVISFTLHPLLAIGLGLGIARVLPGFSGALADTSFWVALPAILVTAEFTNYWVHRWSHEHEGNVLKRWIWPLHRTHHTAKYANVVLHFRLNLFWGLVSPLAWVHTLAIYMGMMGPAVVSISAFSLWGVVTHCNFRWDDSLRRHKVTGRFFRALEHLVVTPGIHHTHHGYGRDGKSYRNYGLLLTVFDWMFGTLHIPQGRPARYGLPGPVPHWAEEIFYPFYRSKRNRGQTTVSHNL